MSYELVISGAGSGGHLFPALAVLEELTLRGSPPDRVVALTTNRPIEQAILADVEIEQIRLPAFDSQSLKRHPIRSLRSLAYSVRQAARLLKPLQRPIMISMGGAGSLPGVLAARRNRIPLLLLEQNAVAGRATSVAVPFATKICFSYPETGWVIGSGQKGTVCGNPVRREIVQLADAVYDSNARELLILGGSQGARILNQSMEQFVKQYAELLTGWRVYHQAGESAFQHMQSIYDDAGLSAVCAPFFSRMAERYRQAGLVISRAGGTSLAELACAGIPSLLVPYPRSIRRHQELNAQYYVDRGGAVSLDQLKPGFDQQFSETLQKLLVDDERRGTMAANMKSCARPDAARQVAELILQLAD